MQKLDFKEEIMASANIIPSSSLNIPRGGKGEKAFYKYRKVQNGLFRRTLPKKFKDLLEK